MGNVSKEQWLYLKIAAVMMCLPVLLSFFAATANNAPLGVQALLSVYGYVLLFSLGWPVWVVAFTVMIFRHRLRGIKWMRNVSTVWLVIFIPAGVMGFVDPSFVNSNIRADALSVMERLMPLTITLPALFPAYYSWKTLRRLKANPSA